MEYLRSHLNEHVFNVGGTAVVMAVLTGLLIGLSRVLEAWGLV